MKRPVREKFYRARYGSDLRYFYVKYKFTDLAVGVSKFELEMLERTYGLVTEMYAVLQKAFERWPDFHSSLSPIPVGEPELNDFESASASYVRQEHGGPVAMSAILVARRMIEASKLADVGPMAAVAGAFAEIVGIDLAERYGLSDIIVENGGDVYVRASKDIRIGLFANFENPFNDLVLILSPGEYGVCTSSGKIGHSLSLGHADAVCVVAENASIADALATKFANMVREPSDLPKVLELAQKQEKLVGLVAVIDGQLGVVGDGIRLERV